MRVLICGSGSIGQRHYKNLQSLGHELAMCRSGKNTGYNSDFVSAFFEAQEEAGTPVTLYYDLDEALRDFDPDAVFVANPNAYHMQIALPAAQAGKHLFLEKPVSATLDDLDELTRLVDEKNLVTMVGYNLRFHPLLKQMREIVVSGGIGSVLSAHVEMGEHIADWHPWEDYAASYGPWREKGGGAALCFSHDIDYLYWFLGMPQKVMAVGGKITPLTGDAEDMTKSLWSYSDGKIASVHLDYWQRPHRRSFHIIGTDGSLYWDYEAQTLTQYPHEGGGEPMTWKTPEDFDRNDMFKEEVQEFMNAVSSGASTSIPLEEGIDVLKITLDITGQL